jgi:hypothetical protein
VCAQWHHVSLPSQPALSTLHLHFNESFYYFVQNVLAHLTFNSMNLASTNHKQKTNSVALSPQANYNN